jgi:hypothetical protein
MSGQSHDYKRHGTSTLFAALEVATGKIVTAHKRRRRRIVYAVEQLCFAPLAVMSSLFGCPG